MSEDGGSFKVVATIAVGVGVLLTVGYWVYVRYLDETAVLLSSLRLPSGPGALMVCFGISCAVGFLVARLVAHFRIRQ